VANPEAREEPGESVRRPIRGWVLAIGGVLGFVATWVAFTATLLWMYATGGRSATTENVISVIGLFALPAILAVLMISRRTRQLGAGFLIGMAAGAIIGAGICAGYMGANF
jgi:hypothetical protein